MSKVVCNLYLESDVVEALDDFAALLGTSRSQAANLVLNSVVVEKSAAQVVNTVMSQLFSGNEETNSSGNYETA